MMSQQFGPETGRRTRFHPATAVALIVAGVVMVVLAIISHKAATIVPAIAFIFAALSVAMRHALWRRRQDPESTDLSERDS